MLFPCCSSISCCRMLEGVTDMVLTDVIPYIVNGRHLYRKAKPWKKPYLLCVEDILKIPNNRWLYFPCGNITWGKVWLVTLPKGEPRHLAWRSSSMKVDTCRPRSSRNRWKTRRLMLFHKPPCALHRCAKTHDEAYHCHQIRMPTNVWCRLNPDFQWVQLFSDLRIYTCIIWCCKMLKSVTKIHSHKWQSIDCLVIRHTSNRLRMGDS